MCVHVCVCLNASYTLAVSNELFKEKLRIDQVPLSLIVCVCVYLAIKHCRARAVRNPRSHIFVCFKSTDPTEKKNTGIRADTMLRCLSDEFGSHSG